VHRQSASSLESFLALMFTDRAGFQLERPSRGSTLSHSTAWLALANRFEALSSETSIEYRVYPSDSSEFYNESLQSRILLRFRPNEEIQEDRLISIRAAGSDPMQQMTWVNRFRWLCWAGGILLNPHASYRPGEVIWLLAATDGDDQVTDVVHRTIKAAKSFERSGQRPLPAPTGQRPKSWWNGRTNSFRRLADRFMGQTFHERELFVTVGTRHTANGIAPNQESLNYINNFHMRHGDQQRSVTSSQTPVASIWGDSEAVNEYDKLAVSAYDLLPAELQVGMGPSIFPPTDYFTHIRIESNWWRWTELMWLLCPTSFLVSQWEPGYAPYISAKGCPAIIAANACDRISAIDDGRQLIQEIRTSLASFNPWLSPEDRQATRLAVSTAYNSEASPVTESIPAIKVPETFELSKRLEVLLIEMLALGAIGSSRHLTQAEVVAKAAPKDDPDNYKRDFARLKKMKLIDSTTGRAGGIWLTALGKQNAQRISG
jgi:hypothetical protein